MIRMQVGKKHNFCKKNLVKHQILFFLFTYVVRPACKNTLADSGNQIACEKKFYFFNHHINNHIVDGGYMTVVLKWRK